MGFLTKNFGSFRKFNPQNYPSQCLLHDGGIYIMLYAENWLGKMMKEFSKEVIPKYKMQKSYDMFHSIENMIVAESFTKKDKKRKR